MEKKKKIIGMILIILVFIGGYVGKQQYQKHKYEQLNKRWAIELVYYYIPTEGELINTVWKKTLKELKEDPPPIQMNNKRGLYISTECYRYFTGRTVDYLDIEQMMNAGQVLEVADKYEDFLGWLDNHPYEKNEFFDTLMLSASWNNIDIGSSNTYKEYKIVLENPELMETFEQAMEDEGYTRGQDSETSYTFRGNYLENKKT